MKGASSGGGSARAGVTKGKGGYGYGDDTANKALAAVNSGGVDGAGRWRGRGGSVCEADEDFCLGVGFGVSLLYVFLSLPFFSCCIV